VNSLVLLCCLLSVSDPRTIHGPLNLVQGLQETFLRLTTKLRLRKMLSNVLMELSDPQEL